MYSISKVITVKDEIDLPTSMYRMKPLFTIGEKNLEQKDPPSSSEVSYQNEFLNHGRICEENLS